MLTGKFGLSSKGFPCPHRHPHCMRPGAALSGRAPGPPGPPTGAGGRGRKLAASLPHHDDQWCLAICARPGRLRRGLRQHAPAGCRACAHTHLDPAGSGAPGPLITCAVLPAQLNFIAAHGAARRCHSKLRGLKLMKRYSKQTQNCVGIPTDMLEHTTSTRTCTPS